MSVLFTPTTIKNMTLSNRFVRSATWEGMADENGSVTPKLITCMATLTKGNIGLIISGHAFVAREGQAGPYQLAAHDNDCLPGLTEMAKAVHREGGRIALQLAHAGAQAATKISGLKPIGPSIMTDKNGNPSNREMNSKDIQALVAAFGQSARRAKEAGFDAVQIHAAHGYLLSQFLSPHFNHRQDNYGGELANRARLLLEVVESVREQVGENYPVLVKMNSEDFLENGFTVDESLLVARRLENQGIDCIELSGGTPLSGKHVAVRQTSRSGQFSDFDSEAWYKETATKFKSQRKIPLMLVGGVRQFETAERLVSEGYCDYISLARPLIREPDLIKRWRNGDRSPAACISDNLCFRPGLTGRGIYCVTKEREQKKKG